MNSQQKSVIEKELSLMTTGLTPGFLEAPRVFSHGRGSYLYDIDGNQYVDFSAGTFTNSTGHCHPEIVDALKEAAEQVWNIHDYSNKNRLPLLENLRKLMPEKVDAFEFYSTGSETIEAGLRVLSGCLPPERNAIMTIHKGFHGKTRGSRHLVHWRLEGEVIRTGPRIHYPDCYRCPFNKSRPDCQEECLIDALHQLETRDDIGAILFEPILGAGGVIIPFESYWKKIQKIAKKKNILLFADEVFTGLGRTGKMFGYEHFDLEPDLIAFAKGLGSGFPIMVLGGRKELLSRPPYGAPGGASTTFGGNPLAIAVARKTLEIYEKEKILENVQALSSVLKSRLEYWHKKYDFIGRAESIGLMGVVDFVVSKASREPDDALGVEVHRFCMDEGLVTYTFGHLFRIVPALNIPIQVLNDGLDILENIFQRVQKNKNIIK